MFDEMFHPDLVETGRVLSHRLDQILEAEQQAAAIAARRLSTLRDRLLDAEDRGVVVAVHTKDGRPAEGAPAVALDHIEVATPSGAVLIPFTEITRVELR